MRVVPVSVVRGVTVVAGLVLLVVFGGAYGPRVDPTPTVFDDPVLVQQYQNRITVDRLTPWVEHLAADSLAGRETGTEGQRAAARYLASIAMELGLTPPPSDASGIDAYRQPFELYGTELAEATLTAASATDDHRSWRYDPQMPQSDIYLAGGTQERVEGPLEYRTLEADSMLIDYEDYAVLQPGMEEEGATWVLGFAPEDLLQPTGETGPYGSNTTCPRLRSLTGTPCAW